LTTDTSKQWDLGHRSVTALTGASVVALAATLIAGRFGGGAALAVGAASLLAVVATGLFLAARAHRESEELATEMAGVANAIRAGSVEVRPTPVASIGDALAAQRAAAALAARFALEAAEFLTTFNGGAVPKAFPGKFEGEMQRAADMSKAFTDMINLRNTDVNMLLEACLQGRLEARADTSKYNGYNGKLVDALNSVLAAARRPILEATGVLERIADRDLTARVGGSFPGDYGRIQKAVNDTAQALHEALAHVSRSTGSLSGAAGQISASTQAVASGATEQASSLEETSSSLESMTSMVKASADNAQQASALAQSARATAGEGAEAMQEMSGAMEKIRASAEGTSQIIKDINEIAFQTNLLALNAAVEAARAGDAGRGFAVVAEEVRSLALRSKDAANKTEALIRESVRQSGEGDATAKLVAGKLTEITGMVGKVTDIVAEIAASAREQANGIAQVTSAVSQMNQVTQQNAASSEQASSAAIQLTGQAEELGGVVSSFRLAGAASAPRAAHSPARKSQPSAAPRPKPQAAARPAAPRAAPGKNGSNGSNGLQLKPEEVIPLDGDPSFDEF